MLDVLRKKKEHWVSAFIVLAVAVVMAFFGVSKFQDDKADPNQPVAWVNGEVISQRDFYSELQFTLNQYRSILGDRFDEKLFGYQLPKQTLERMVQFRLLVQQAEKMGFLVSDQELADQIKSSPYFQKDGKFDAVAYSQIPNRGMMERRQREQMAASRLQGYLTNRIKSLPTDSTASRVLSNTQVELEYAAIDFDQLAPKQPPTLEKTKSILENETLLKQQYEARLKDFTDKGKYQFRQIRVGLPFEASTDARKKAEEKAQTIKKTLTPETFESVAKAMSDDEFAKKGGNRGWIEEGSMDPVFEDALGKLQKNEVSPVITAPGGLFLLQLTDRVASKTRALESVKAQLAEQIAREQIKTEFVDTTRKNWETLVSQGKPLISELQKYKVPVKRTGKFSLDKNSIPEVGNSESMLEALYELSPAQPIAKRLFFNQDKYYYLKLLSVGPISSGKNNATESDSGKTEANLFQRDLFQTWLSTIEKQASIKLTNPVEPKTKG